MKSTHTRALTVLEKPPLMEDSHRIRNEQARFHQVQDAEAHGNFLSAMIRIDRLSQSLREAVTEKPGMSVMLVSDDGAPIACSDDSEESQTIGAAAASIFLEYKATDKFSFPPLTSFVYSAKNRTVMCKYLASLSDNSSVLICAFCKKETPLTLLDSLVAEQVAALHYLIPVFAGMSRKVID